MGRDLSTISVLDKPAYTAKFEELMSEAHAEAKRTGARLDSGDITRIARDANDHGYSTEFSVIATEMIRGNSLPAQERCRKERAEFGEERARDLMRSFQDAVRERLQRMR